MSCIKRILFLFTLCLPINLSGQIPAVSGGLVFSSGLFMNNLGTGNPAIYGKVYFKINEKLKIVPGLSAFSPKKRAYPAESTTLKNYMFHGDCDINYSFYKEHPLRFVAVAGVNGTYIKSVYKPEDNPQRGYENTSELNPGINLGAGIIMFVDNNFDAYISGKYVAGKFDQFIINIGVIFYMEGLRRKGGW